MSSEGVVRIIRFIALGALVSCSSPLSELPGPTKLAPPSRPEGCQSVSSFAELETALNGATAGSSICLEPGEYVGGIEVAAGVTLWGTRDAVIRSSGQGTTVVLSPGSALLGLTVDGSGGRFDTVDAAVKVRGDDIRVEGVRVERSAFGILSEKSKRVHIVGNHVQGLGGPALGLRGDGIRIWETHDSVVEDNEVEDSRDCVVWYSSDNVVRRNLVRGGRYGVHIMYSHRNRVEENLFERNEVGVFIMYARNVEVLGNVMLSSGGSAGIGLGIKESGNLTVRRNRLIHNTQGIFLDNSPLNPDDRNLFEDNEIRMSDLGIGFLSSQKNNVFRRNHFRDNFTQVRVDGGGDALEVSWEGNAWSDYAGYDLDGDGIGDIPHELRDLAGALEARHGDLAFFRGTPALALISVAGHVVPLFQPKTLLRDERPSMRLEEPLRAN